MAQGSKLTAGQVPLSGGVDAIPAKSGSKFRLKNLSAANPVNVGPASPTLDATNGYVLAPGESVDIDVVSPNSIRVLGTSGQRVAWIAIS
jgi:hypothetical protein